VRAAEYAVPTAPSGSADVWIASGCGAGAGAGFGAAVAACVTVICFVAFRPAASRAMTTKWTVTRYGYAFAETGMRAVAAPDRQATVGPVTRPPSENR
jgi:uncharacterized membrane protein YhiD involved in acid resistance